MKFIIRVLNPYPSPLWWKSAVCVVLFGKLYVLHALYDKSATGVFQTQKPIFNHTGLRGLGWFHTILVSHDGIP